MFKSLRAVYKGEKVTFRLSLLEALKETEELISEGYEIEAKGRALASDREAYVDPNIDGEWAADVAKWHFRVADFCRKFETIFFTEEEYGVIDTLGIISRCTAQDFIEVCKSASKNGARRKDRMVTFTPYLTSEVANDLKFYDEKQMRLTGRSGIWLYGRLMTIDEYTFSAFLNDYTSCFHQFLNWVDKKVTQLNEVANRVFATPDATPLAVRIATMWREAVEVYSFWHLYDKGDYNALHALCRLSNIEFRVGSTPGHATHVTAGSIFTEAIYYDTDESVHDVFMRLCRHYRCRVLSHKENESTSVSIPRVRISEFFQGTLPFVTSMDFRLKSPIHYWGREFSGELEVLKDLPPLGREFGLCLKAYERFIKERR
jgi:hypothetical protein